MDNSTASLNYDIFNYQNELSFLHFVQNPLHEELYLFFIQSIPSYYLTTLQITGEFSREQERGQERMMGRMVHIFLLLMLLVLLVQFFIIPVHSGMMRQFGKITQFFSLISEKEMVEFVKGIKEFQNEYFSSKFLVEKPKRRQTKLRGRVKIKTIKQNSLLNQPRESVLTYMKNNDIRGSNFEITLFKTLQKK